MTLFMRVAVGIAAASLLLAPHAAAAQCCGDCSGDGSVTIDDILTVVNHALTSCSNDGICSMASCPAQLATCRDDLAICQAQPGGRLLATGQTMSYTAGDDGALRIGAVLRYVDNGQTITDLNTGLMWEKKTQLDGTPSALNLNDADNLYAWAGTCQTAAALCGVDSDCGTNGPCNAADGQGGKLTIFKWVAALNAETFGGHSDWRVPNLRELESIADLVRSNPAVATAFNGMDCGVGNSCTDLTSPTCSCTQDDFYLSSSTYQNANPLAAWAVNFADGDVTEYSKIALAYVRAVRGGA